MNNNTNTKEHQLPVLRFRTECGSEDVHYPVIYDGLPQEFKSMAAEELKETDDSRLNGIQMLKDHINSEKLHSIPDYMLLAILRVSKYDMKKAKNKLEKAVNMRRAITGLLVKTGLQQIERVIDNYSFGVLSYRDKYGRCIIYTRPDGFNFEQHSVDDVGVACMVTLLFLLQFPISIVSGITYFADCKHPSVSYVYPIVKTFKRFMWYPLSLPIRIAKVEILNPVAAAHWFYKMVKPLFPQKLTKRVSFIPKGYNMLLNSYNENILPEEFGGKMGPLINSHFKEEVLEFAKKLIEEYE